MNTEEIKEEPIGYPIPQDITLEIEVCLALAQALDTSINTNDS